MSDADDLEAVVATELQRIDRLAHLGDRSSAGPDATPNSPAPVVPVQPSKWRDGFWSEATRSDAHPARMGGAIRPSCVVVHSMDTCPEDWAVVLNHWKTQPGDGSCTTFAIGRDATQGVVQLVPITRNANHAGGPGHGWFVVPPSPVQIHPNTVAVGIELNCAGGVRLVQGQWRLVEDGVAHGLPIPAAEVTPDPVRPGRGWHNATPYQLERLRALLVDLRSALAPQPAGTKTVAVGQAPDAFTVMPAARIVTHAQLDPEHRADPWHPVCDWLRANYADLT